MRKRTTIEIETFQELENLNNLCITMNESEKSGCSKCAYYEKCINDDCIWMYLEIVGATPEIVKNKFDRGRRELTS